MRSLLIVCLLVAAWPAWAQPLPDSRQQEIVIRNVTIIPMDKEQVLPNQTVVVKDGKISLVGDARTIRYSANATVIDGTGKFLLPGLTEMHAHVPPIDDIAPMKKVVLLFALKGVTTIRGMLGHPRHLELRSKLQSGEIIGPRLYTSGPSINGQTAADPATAARMVREQQAAGYDFLKLHPGLTLENFNIIVKTAREVKIPFAGHVSYGVGVWRAIEAGYASIDHMDGFVEGLVPGIENISEKEVGLFGVFIAKKADTTKLPRLTKALREKRVWVVPTQSLAERWISPAQTPEALGREPEMVYMQPNTLTGWINAKKSLQKDPRYVAAEVEQYVALRRQLIKACQQQGVGLLLGSDAPQIFDVPGFSLHHELSFMVKAGLTPYEALRTGTVNPARFFQDNNAGVIKPGARADLLLLNSNPLQRIEASQDIAGVVLAGRWLSQSYIDTELARLATEKTN
ncbi:amidohydrolase family protein [Paraflavitalea pollutisoli]|uniref:amidohydrolase family protein n=1 Tax=Paraflavitalea pollutisoli TaxID=3034143 RepID=UPI0023EC5DCE|nr:amidohydrolase family protein [Paraflavitalea sp. H1-2-19X]